MNTPRLLPIALAIPRTNFLGPPAVWCGLGLHREKNVGRAAMTEQRCIVDRTQRQMASICPLVNQYHFCRNPSSHAR